MTALPPAKGAIRPFPAPSVRYKRRREEAQRDLLAEEFEEFRQTHPELTGQELLQAFREHVKEHPAILQPQVVPKIARVQQHAEPREPRQVELYLGFPISEELRRSFEAWLNANPSVSEEDGAALLLEKGLRGELVEASFEEPGSRPTVIRSRYRTGCHARMARLQALLLRS